ncbi:MAG: hypothetical protein LBF72_00815 [Holosporales bacterium]|nr:hypothetical protein [Holosporales bacterium]
MLTYNKYDALLRFEASAHDSFCDRVYSSGTKGSLDRRWCHSTKSVTLLWRRSDAPSNFRLTEYIMFLFIQYLFLISFFVG